MGLFDDTTQTTDASTRITTYDNDTTTTTNIQDSNNTVTSITDAFNTSLAANFTNNISDAFNSTIAQPIAVITGGGGANGLDFDLDNFFAKGLEPAANATMKDGLKPKSLIIWGVIAFVGYIVIKKFVL